MDDIILGWREWVALPDLGIAKIKAKVDSGARTSCLHTFEYEKFDRDQQSWIRFAVHPVQDDQETVIRCEARMVDERMVSDSGGHRELRPVIRTLVDLGLIQFEAEFTLTNRDSMRFRMLIGRSAMDNGILVNPAGSYLLQKESRKKK